MRDRRAVEKREERAESNLDHMADITVSKEHFKKNLIFTNTKNCRNSDLYGKVLDELNLLHDSTFPFNLDQIRNKFKKFQSARSWR